jgi:hypothetical protein
MKLNKLIQAKYGKCPWYNRLENGYNKREFIIYANSYPYTEECDVYEFAKTNKIKISIHLLGS